MPRDRAPQGVAADGERKDGMPGSGSSRPQWRAPFWSRSPLLHEWIRSGGILIAAAWGVYTFVYKDIYVPSQQPAHLTLEATLKPVPDRARPAAGLEMQLEIKATNASSRRVFLLANIWTLRSINDVPRTGPKAERDFIDAANVALNGQPVLHKERGVERSTGKLIAIGRLFGDDFIDPSNTKNRSILVSIPAGTKAVEVSVILPLLSKQPQPTLFKGQRLAWEVDPLGDTMLLLCTQEDGRPTSGNSRCRSYGEQDEKALKQFDQQSFTVTLDQQIGLPVGAEK